MSEENLNQEEGTPISGESNPSMDRASSNGWRPLEDWVADGRPEEDWVDYREFNVRGELMGKIQGMGRKLSALEQANEKLQEATRQAASMTKDMVDKQYERAMADLKRQRREALEVGDFDAVDELDDRRDELADKRKELDAQAEPAVAEPEKKDFTDLHPIEQTFINIVNTNPDLVGNEERIKQVGKYADEIWGANPDIGVAEFVRKLDQHMNPPRDRAPGPDGNRSAPRPKSNGSKFSKGDLSEMELEFAKTFVDTGAYKSIQEYVDDAAANGMLEIQQR